ncbi:MAG: YihY/virulence factor BrkB family protein [Thermomicrobiaceae bacterium]
MPEGFESNANYRFGLLQRAYLRYSAIHGHIYAAAISYFSMISLFPWLIFILTLLSFLVRDPVVQSQIVTQVVEQFPPGARIRIELRSFVAEITLRRSGLIGFAGLVTTVIVASEAFRSLRFALNTIFGTPQTRTFLRGRALDLLGMVVVLIFGLITTLLAIVLQFNWVSENSWILGPEGTVLTNIARYLLPLLISFVAFTLMYRIVPEIRLDWSVLWIPGLIAAAGFELARLGMQVFLNYFGRFQQLYGALSVTVVTLVFVFIVANIVLLAAALAWEIAQDRSDAKE